jgi:magnesium and cobalt transporter
MAQPAGNAVADSGAGDDDKGGEVKGGGRSRGLFDRLINAFTGGEADGDSPGKGDDAAGGSTQPHGLGNLRRLTVADVATPRSEIVAVPVTIPLEELVETFRDSGFSRLPVYKGSLDTPLGIIHLKDLALQQAFTDPAPRFALRKMLRPLLYVPPSMTLGVLLQKMQSGRIHMAMLIDEYGGVDGLVTIEDLIEEVVGEIEDEHDTLEDMLLVEESPGVYLAQARATIEEFEEEAGIRLAVDDEDEDVDTLGGFVSMISGGVPSQGEVITHESGVSFEVVEADPRRIRRLRVRLPEGTVG